MIRRILDLVVGSAAVSAAVLSALTFIIARKYKLQIGEAERRRAEQKLRIVITPNGPGSIEKRSGKSTEHDEELVGSH